MPSLKDLNKFRNDLRNIGNEMEVIAEWGEKFEEYPLPEKVPVPDLDVDDLLGSIQLESPADAENVENANAAPEDLSAEKPDLNLNEGSAEKESGAAASMEEAPDVSGIEEISEEADMAESPEESLPSLEEEFPEKQEDFPFEMPDINSFDFSEPASNKDSDNKAETETGTPIDSFEGNMFEDVSDTELPEEQEPTAENNFNIENIPFPPAGTFAMPETGEEHSDILEETLTPFPEDTESGNDESVGFSEGFDIPMPSDGSEVSLFKEPFDKETSRNSDLADEENKKETFGDMISDFDLDFDSENSDGAADTENESPDLPEDLLSGLSSLVEDAKNDKSGKEELEDAGNGLDSYEDLDTFAEDSGFEDSNISETEVPPIIDEADEGADSDINAADEMEEMPSLEKGSEPENPYADGFPGFEASGFDEDGNLEDSQAETIPEVETVAEAETEPEAGTAAEAETVSEASAESEEALPFDLKTEEDTAEEPEEISEAEEDSFEKEEASGMEMTEGEEIPNIESSEIGSHTGFAITDDVLDESIEENTSGNFAIPEDFSKFSAENNLNYNSKKEEAAAKGAGSTPLSISPEDYEYLLDRLASFPLNVRLEIQDYLANGKDTEISKMELINLIINDVSLKKIAARLGDTLEKSIPIPKGFERKSVEEYELEKKSFKYRFMHKILPAAVLASLILLLTFCLGVLTWQFIYKPAVSESIYKEGFAAIDSNEYKEAMRQFDEAGLYKKKRKWYFRYANAFRKKKQFNSAEEIYKRLLFDFNHDKQGGIEYSQMLSKDLRNYEKAENVLRRSVLDYHINDEQALAALADVYLDWAYEDPSKYEKAKEKYFSLIEMYGKKDIFLSGIMKYFIRTDNLAEVLPLKEHFMNRKAKIDLDDLTELGGYLLEKRYEPKPSDSESLRAQIDDLRDILEKAIRRDNENADANYNMGRFFVYNRKPEAAEMYLLRAIKIYENEIGMQAHKIINSMDSMRLYGEILSGKKEFLQAQEIFAGALSKYKEYSDVRLLPPDKTIGKIYENYADISYFISGDMDSALNAYTQATKEMNNTPSIHYKIGYIHYQKGNYLDAMNSMTLVYSEKPNDRNLLYGFGNVLYKRGSYYAAQAYYERLMEMLEAEKIRKGFILPQTRPDHGSFVEEFMRAANNLGVILNRIAVQSGDSGKNGRALALLGESARAWDALTRNPQTMISSKAVSLAYLNIQNMVRPVSSFETEIYTDIPKTLQNDKILTQKNDR